MQWSSASNRSARVAAPRTAPRRGRIVVVLGASSGIGRACARAFARQGATVVLVARGEERLAAAQQECVDEGAAASLALPADVLDQDRLHDVVDVVTSTYGRIDVVVHSANVMAYGRLEQVPPAVFERTVATAIHGTANLARAVVPTLRAQGFGTLMIVTSLLASVPVPWMGAYIAGKWGQAGLARVLQIEQRDVPGVHVCTVAPGSVDTPIFRQAANFAGRSGRPPPPVASADAVARAVVRSADRPRRRRSVGLANGFIVLGYRLLPRVYDWLVGPLARLGAFARDTRAPTDGNVFTPLRPMVDDDQRLRAPRAGSGDGSHL